MSNGKKRKASQEPPFPLHEGVASPSFTDSLEAVAELLRSRKNIVVLTGAGISVSSGIPDFRSKSVGLYETLDTQGLGLTCPEDLFDLNFFREDPVPFYKFARQLYFPGNGKDRIRPSDSHKLLALLEKNNMLLRCYTQNIDGLEEDAGVTSKRVVHAHGSLRWATCSKCKRRSERKDMEDDILAGRVALCSSRSTKVPKAAIKRSTSTSSTSSNSSSRQTRGSQKRPAPTEASNVQTRKTLRQEGACNGVLKPGVTFFGETLGDKVGRSLQSDFEKLDALIVIGTSLSVAPISKVISYLPPDIPRILINRTVVHPAVVATDNEQNDFREDYVFDAYLLGNCDDVTRALGQVLFSNGKKTKKSTAVDIDHSTKGRLLSSLYDDEQAEWDSVAVPHDRVLLFSGAAPPTSNLVADNAESALAPKFHEIAHCDGCKKRIKSTIYKCRTCFDYDLCSKCFGPLSKTHCDGEHTFVKEASKRKKGSGKK